MTKDHPTDHEKHHKEREHLGRKIMQETVRDPVDGKVKTVTFFVRVHGE